MPLPTNARAEFCSELGSGSDGWNWLDGFTGGIGSMDFTGGIEWQKILEIKEIK